MKNKTFKEECISLLNPLKLYYVDGYDWGKREELVFKYNLENDLVFSTNYPVTIHCLRNKDKKTIEIKSHPLKNNIRIIKTISFSTQSIEKYINKVIEYYLILKKYDQKGNY